MSGRKRLNPEARTFMQTLRREGWALVGRTRSGHLQFTHPAVGIKLTVAATPSDYRTRRHELARARRMVRQATGGNW